VSPLIAPLILDLSPQVSYLIAKFDEQSYFRTSNLSRLSRTPEAKMKKSDLAKHLKDAAYLTGQFTLRSGKTSTFYWDKYRFESDPTLLDAVVDEMIRLLPSSFDRLAGLEMGGIPLATALSLRTRKHCLFVRKTAKTYGTCNLVEGGFSEGETAVVIEDVITVAGQVCSSVEQMRKLGLKVEDVVCVIDRQQGGRENLEKIGCSLKSVFTLKELEQLKNS
jgi:orotate phosphoribosyltransferase